MKNSPLVSVLVHTKNSARTIEKHLLSIQNQTYQPIEIIVVDNYSKDNTLTIAKKYTKKIYLHGPERSAQRNYAAKKAKGKYFLIPDSDMILGKDVIKECVGKALADKKLKAIVVTEISIGTGFWAKCKQLERSFYVSVPWMEGARFFDRAVFFKLGGYDEKNTGTEDFDLPQRIRETYGHSAIGRIKDVIYHDEGNLTLGKMLTKKFYYAQKLDIYKKNNLNYYKIQSSILKRYMLFFSQPQKLLKNPVTGFGLLFMKTTEFVAGGAGYWMKRFSII